MTGTALATSPGDFAELPLVTSPHGAQAAACQMMSSQRIQFPTGFEARDSRSQCATTQLPHKDSAMWYKQIHAGYMSAQFIGYACSHLQMLHLLNSEQIEIKTAAAWNKDADVGYGGTLKPRRMAVWVQVNDDVARADSGHRILDALAEWSQFVTPKGHKIANEVRMAILVGSDSENFMARTQGQSVRFDQSQKKGWALRISIRWVNDKGEERTETEQFVNVPATTNGALALIQQTVVRLSGAHDAPVHVALMVPVAEPVKNNAFFGTLVKLYNQWASLVVGDPSCTFDAAASHPGSAPLENTGVVVRLCMRRMGDKGISDATAFHGVLLGFRTFQDEARSFAKSAADSPEGYLSVPIGAQEAAMALHVCAVHAERRELGNLVTLYGPLGKCGQPIHEHGGTWVWLESAAIRPIDEALLKDWCVYPCARASIMPSNRAFHEAYRTHFTHASNLYTNLDHHRMQRMNSATSLSTVSTDTTTSLEVLPPRPDSAMSAEEKLVERQVLTGFRVNLDSERTTIGEACAYLMEADPSSAIVGMLLSSAGKLGVAASVKKMIELCKESIEISAGPAIAEENTRLKRLAEVALAARATELVVESELKRAKTATLAPAERVRRMLKTIGLKAGGHAVLHRSGTTNVSDVVHVVCTALGINTAPGAACLAFGQLRIIKADDSQSAWEGLVTRALSAASDVSMRGAGQTNTGCLFFLSSRKTDEGVFVERLSADGKLVTSHFDALVQEATPQILIVNYLDKGQVRVTATVPM